MAPPPKRVDDLHAVPIHVRHIEARLAFHAAAEEAVGDAVIDFDHGCEDGCPIFDLRQPVAELLLDGEPLEVREAFHRDFGGGAWAHLRVVPRVLKAGSRHRLQVRYGVQHPAVPTAGGRQPALQWVPGGVRFCFGFSDLGAGRYLESWVPANLIYNRFSMNLRLTIASATRPHTLVTNAAKVRQDGNDWNLEFPDTTTALSPMVELHPSDEVRCYADQTTLPVSRRKIQVELWKPASSRKHLGASLGRVVRNLEANERLMGRYLHGPRYVAFLQDRGGMEYDGGCTSAVDALQHEVFHSWWARGLKPASQCDGWIDEAWTIYNDSGARTMRPFDFASAPVELCSPNPWTRHTPGAAYTEGYRFFQGLAKWFGANALNAWMAAFYKKHAPGLVTTRQLEDALAIASGDPRVHLAFQHFVYGRPAEISSALSSRRSRARQ